MNDKLGITVLVERSKIVTPKMRKLPLVDEDSAMRQIFFCLLDLNLPLEEGWGTLAQPSTSRVEISAECAMLLITPKYFPFRPGNQRARVVPNSGAWLSFQIECLNRSSRQNFGNVK